MHVVNLAVRLSEEAGAEGAAMPAWAFGGFAFVALCALLVATMMIKVGR